MKQLIVLSLLISLGTGCVFSQVINALLGTTPTINGSISAGEWSDANLVTFSNGQGIITVYFKHDGNALYFAADIIDSVYYWGDDIVISIDPDHNAGTLPQTDDIELYIRRDNITTVLFQGSGNGWIPMSNITGLSHQTSSSSGKWQAECSIIYSRLGITAGTAKTIGVEFRNYDDLSGWFNYPIGGAELIPDTWADLAMDMVNSITRDTESEIELKVYPNPARNKITIESPQLASIEILNIHGQALKTLATSHTKANIDISGLPAGLYIIKATTNRGFVIKKFAKQ